VRHVRHHGARHSDRGVLGLVVGPLGSQGESLLKVLYRRYRLIVVPELLLETP
jgi:hypothetical protein